MFLKEQLNMGIESILSSYRRIVWFKQRRQNRNPARTSVDRYVSQSSLHSRHSRQMVCLEIRFGMMGKQQWGSRRNIREMAGVFHDKSIEGIEGKRGGRRQREGARRKESEAAPMIHVNKGLR